VSASFELRTPSLQPKKLRGVKTVSTRRLPQGTPAFTLFYIQEGGVRLTTRSKHQPLAVTAILGVGDFFGGLCLVGLPLRMSTAVALTASSIRVIKKESMIRMLQKKKLSNSFVSYLFSCIKKYQDHVAELLTSSAEQRLEMVGTTRSRINLFMNRFRKQGFIRYNGGIEVHSSLRKVLRSQ
jgi:CRP/FNR family cyclic AMP-dependent transcriptional regulator